MKYSLLFVLALTAFAAARSQSYESKTEYNKVQQPAILCEFAYPASLVEEVVETDLKQKGLGKAKSTKGFNLYQAVNFTEISGDKIDFYISIDRKSRKEKDLTTVAVLVSKGYDNFISGSSDAAIMQNVMTYVNGLKDKLEKASLEIKIADQEAAVKKEDKRYNDLIDEAADLEKKRRKIESDIEDNKKNQEKQKAEAAKQKEILETLRAQRKG